MFTFSRPYIGITVPLLAFLILVSNTATLFAADWVKVHDDKGKCGNNFNPDDTDGKNGFNLQLCGISGMALLPPEGGRTEFLVVHDAKWDKGIAKRLGIVTIGSKPESRVNYRSLDWPTGHTPPDDLEAVSSVPGQPRQFLALASNGQVFPLTVTKDNRTVRLGLFTESGEKVTLTKSFMLPEPPPTLMSHEGLSVQRLGGQLVIAWGYRGAGTTLGILYYGLLNLEAKKDNEIVIKFGSPRIKVQIPSPSESKTRHIADLKIDENGVVWASATSDPQTLKNGRDIGPFDSALHILGVLSTTTEPSVQLEPRLDTIIPLWLRTFTKRKIEAIEFVPGPDGGIVFGTDDEDLGGWLYFK